MEEYNIFPCSSQVDLTNGCHKLSITQTQKMQMSSLLSQLPEAVISSAMPTLYTVSFPNGGSPDKLMRMGQGGVSSAVMDGNKISAHASFHSMGLQALAMSCFTFMEVASSQYFLKQIGTQLQMMKLNLDKILGFLYGDKKAELISEFSFIKYAYENYASIMKYNEQRIGIIQSIYNAKKVAMKDIEFYINDLDSVIENKSGDDIASLAEKAFQIKESLELALQLYGFSGLLEIYYSQNFDSEYLDYIENDISIYIDKCEKRMLSDFSALKILISSAKGTLFKKIDKDGFIKRIDDLIDLFNKGEKSELCQIIKASLSSLQKEPTYYMTADGDVYIKEA